MTGCGCRITTDAIGYASYIVCCPLHESAAEMLKLIDDLNYTLTNGWAPDYKKFHDMFKPRCMEVLAKASKEK